MPSVEVKHLYNYNRFPIVSNKLIPLLLYLPIGLLLVLLRFILFLPILLFCTLLPQTQLVHGILLKLLCITLGITINVENAEKKEDVDAYVSNQISLFDTLVVHSLTGSIAPGFQLDTQLSPIFGVKYFGPSSNLETIKNNISVFIGDNKTPMYFQPEGTITNRNAVLKFKTWPFVLCSKVQPIAIEVRRPLFNIGINSIDSSFWSDVFFYMFSPLTVYNVHFLPSMDRKGVLESEFAVKLQQDIAKALKIEAVDHSSADLLEFRKRYHIEKQRAQVVNQRPVEVTNQINPELHRMSVQVKEVLPMVPMNVILRDLVKTKNVDITITNILEGVITYVPEPIVTAPSTSNKSHSPSRMPPGEESSSTSSSSNTQVLNQTSKDIFNTAASSFGKSASERSLSFQERKQQLIESARARYIEKHSLDIVALNNC